MKRIVLLMCALWPLASNAQTPTDAAPDAVYYVVPSHTKYMAQCLPQATPNVSKYIEQHPQINTALCQCHYEVFQDHPPQVSELEHMRGVVDCFTQIQADPGAFTQKYVQRAEQTPDAPELLNPTPAE